MATLPIAAVAAWLAVLVLPSAGETPVKQNAAFNCTGTSSRGRICFDEAPQGNEQSDITSGEQRGWGRTEPCPPCPSLFGKLKQTRLGTTEQHVRLQVRARTGERGLEGGFRRRCISRCAGDEGNEESVCPG